MIILKNKVYRPINKSIVVLLKILLKNKKLNDTIIIESHNDFDANGGALYNYLIEKKYNEKYKIIWLIKNMAPNNLPKNVVCYNIFKPNIAKGYHICTAKYFFSDDVITDKVREDQKSIYLGHGGGIGFKNVVLPINNSVDYVLMSSYEMAPIIAPFMGLKYPSEKIQVLGFPEQDVFYNHQIGLKEMKKLKVSCEYSKVIVWMPTFRRGGGAWRNDSSEDLPLGIPLARKSEDLIELNDFLQKKEVLLIIKIHPMQWLGGLKIHNMSNIVVLTKNDMKEYNLDMYKLLAGTDGLISDFSSIAVEYFHMHKPIAYVFEDIKNYNMLAKETSHLLIGSKIYTLEEMKKFIEGVCANKDDFREEREKAFEKTHYYHDGNSCERIVNFLDL